MAAALVSVAACGSGVDSAPRGGELTLEQARAFDEFPLYYAGTQVDSLPLVAIRRRDDEASYVSFVYGDCRPAGFDQGCAPPAEVQTWPGARRGLDDYDATDFGRPPLERVTVRRLPAAFLDGGTRLELSAGRATVVVFADSRVRVLRIAAALRCLTAQPPGPPREPLEC